MSFFQHLSQLRRHYVKKYGRYTLQTIDHFIGRQSLIGDLPVFDAKQFTWVDILEANWKPIRAELETILKAREYVPSFQQISPDQQRIAKGDNWKTFVLYGFGRQAARNCHYCPETVRVLETISSLRNAWFSILAPGYHIPPHRGVTKGLLRCHLALTVPQQREHCVIRIDDQRLQWQEGKCLVFDDTYEHEVWNNTDEERVVLFIDIDRPLKPLGRLINMGLLNMIQWTAYVKDARRNLVHWEDRFETAMQRAENFNYGDKTDEDLTENTPPV
jgi:beta-hydroxylase